MLRRGTHEHALVDFAPPVRGIGAAGGLDSRFAIHDDNQVELKLDYAIDGDSKWTRYQTEAFIFIPRSLCPSKRAYDRRKFFSDTQAYIRFKTPRMTLAAMRESTNENSPLVRIGKLVDSVGQQMAPAKQARLSEELRMFGCLVRSNMRDMSATAGARLRELDLKRSGYESQFDSLEVSVGRFADEIDDVCRRLRQLRSVFLDIRCPEMLRDHYRYADEFVSITVESYLTELLVLLKQWRAKRRLRELTDSVWDRLGKTIAHEQQHRRDQGYPSDLADKKGRHTYVNRASILKKFVTSVLFLRIAPSQEDVSAMQLGAGIAAAVAMTFSVGAALLSERLWGINSLPFIVAVVIAYVFKDRIKDWIKSFFSSTIARWMPDRSLMILDPENGLQVGKCRETLSYLPATRVPESVRRWRHADEGLESEYNPELCLHYIKDVRLLGKRIRNTHNRRRGLNDIIRWNVSSLLTRTDDPERHVDYLDAKLNELLTAVCPKRYQLNIVLVLKESNRLVSVQRYKVELDRNGIQTLESVSLNGE